MHVKFHLSGDLPEIALSAPINGLINGPIYCQMNSEVICLKSEPEGKTKM
jgi:hypothetical protein